MRPKNLRPLARLALSAILLSLVLGGRPQTASANCCAQATNPCWIHCSIGTALCAVTAKSLDFCKGFFDGCMDNCSF